MFSLTVTICQRDDIFLYFKCLYSEINLKENQNMSYIMNKCSKYMGLCVFTSFWIIGTSVSIVGFKIIKINNRQLQILMAVFHTNIYFMFFYLLFFHLVFFLSAHLSSPWSNILRWNSTTLMNTPGGATLLEDSLRSLQRSWFLCGCCTLWVSLQDHWDRYCHTLLLSCYCYLSDNSFKNKNQLTWSMD